MKNSQFLCFQGDNYYPNGGWLDFVGSRDNLEDATILASIDQTDGVNSSLTDDPDWWHVVDSNLGVIVASNDPEELGRSVMQNPW